MKKYLLYPAVLLLFNLSLQCKKETLVLSAQEVDLLIGKINVLRQSGCNCGMVYMPPVAPLALNSQLQNAAIKHAEDMALRNYFAHLSPEGGTPNERVLNAGYTGVFRGENLARGYQWTDQVIAAWKSSTSHCLAMMDANSKEAGTGMAQNYWVVAFGSNL